MRQQASELDRSRIRVMLSSTLNDMHKRLYLDQIARAEREGEVRRFGEAHVDQWSHLIEPDEDRFYVLGGVQLDNTRLLDAAVFPLLRTMEPGGNILNVGAGLGVELSMMKEIAPHAHVDTISLTPIAPFVQWKPRWKESAWVGPRFYAQVRDEVHQRIQSGVEALQPFADQLSKGRVDIELLFILQEVHGFSLYTNTKAPLVRHQYIGDLWSTDFAYEGQPYDLIYGNNCPVVKRPFGSERSLEKVTSTLSARGAMYLPGFADEGVSQQENVLRGLDRFKFNGLVVWMGGLLVLGESHPKVGQAEQVLSKFGTYRKETRRWTVLPHQREEVAGQAFS